MELTEVEGALSQLETFGGGVVIVTCSDARIESESESEGLVGVCYKRRKTRRFEDKPSWCRYFPRGMKMTFRGAAEERASEGWEQCSHLS